jgi:predicted dehydrogenase
VEKDHPGVRCYDSLADLIEAGAEAIAISTPADTHIPLAREALERGIPVISDKPFALDAQSARETVEFAESNGVILTVYQNRRWDSDLLTIRGLIRAGELGEIRNFESRFERFAPVPGPPAAGGGTLRDFGSHLVDQAMFLFGPVDSVYAEMRLGGDASGADDLPRDDEFFAALTHVSGVRSHLRGSWVQGAPGPRQRLSGTAGAYVVHGTDSQEPALVAGRTPATEGDDWGVEPENRWGRIHRGDEDDPGQPYPSERGRWDVIYPAFTAAVRGEGAVPVQPRDAVAALEVLDAARLSAREGRVVDVGESPS